MAMDHFMEEVVVKHKRGLNEFLYFLSWGVMIVTGLSAMMMFSTIFINFSIPGLLILLLNAAAAVLLFLFNNRLRTEFEYTFTNGALDFAMVFNNNRRKNLGSLDVRKVEAFGAVSHASFQRYLSMNGIRRMNWFLNREGQLYYFFFQKDGQKKLIIFEPSEGLVGYIQQYLPRGVMQA